MQLSFFIINYGIISMKKFFLCLALFAGTAGIEAVSQTYNVFPNSGSAGIGTTNPSSIFPLTIHL